MVAGYLREWRDAEGAAMVARVEDRRSEAVKAPAEDEDLSGAAASLRADEEQAAQVLPPSEHVCGSLCRIDCH